MHERVSVTNELPQAHAKALEFVVSAESRKIFVRLVDLERGEVIREYAIGSAPLGADSVNGYVPGRLVSVSA
ncbi:Uncharacterized protein ToN1_48440 [Aromatoleum petrolei]|nr:Uncharacterized protein ToN1_48440 [Aromatoleum petrolei]